MFASLTKSTRIRSVSSAVLFAMIVTLSTGCGEGASGTGAGTVDLSGAMKAAEKENTNISKAGAARSKGMSGDATKAKAK